jgi:hypothetical protein
MQRPVSPPLRECSDSVQDSVVHRWRSKLGVKAPTDPTGVFSARFGAGLDQPPRPFEFAYQGPSGAAVLPSAEPAKSECVARFLARSRSVRLPSGYLFARCLGSSVFRDSHLIDIPQLRKLQDLRVLNAMPPNVWESYFDWNLLSKVRVCRICCPCLLQKTFCIDFSWFRVVSSCLCIAAERKARSCSW